MSKFKEGDRVRYTGVAGCTEWFKKRIGETGTVSSIQDSGAISSCWITFDSNPSQQVNAMAANLELVDPVDLSGAGRIAAERKRQVEVEGYADDSENDNGQLTQAALCYLKPDSAAVYWPWNGEYWKPTPENRVRELEKAGAFIAAEIDRLLAVESEVEPEEEEKFYLQFYVGKSWIHGGGPMEYDNLEDAQSYLENNFNEDWKSKSRIVRCITEVVG